MSVDFQAFIGGKWQPASSGSTFKVENPATGQVVGSVSDCDTKDLSLAIGRNIWCESQGYN